VFAVTIEDKVIAYLFYHKVVRYGSCHLLTRTLPGIIVSGEYLLVVLRELKPCCLILTPYLLH